MATLGFLTQRLARLQDDLAKAEKAHRPTRRLRRLLVETRRQLLDVESNHARIAPARKARAARRAPQQPTLFEGAA